MNQVQLVRRLLGLEEGMLFTFDDDEHKSELFGDGHIYGDGQNSGFGDGLKLASWTWQYPDSPDNS